MKTSSILKGTTVEVQIDLASSLTLEGLFREYTNEDSGFDRTKIYVRLFDQGETFMSRSEAKRILEGLDRFEEIVLDFDRVEAIGQGFADEIFRVYAKGRPTIKIDFINASEDVKFMIDRSRATL